MLGRPVKAALRRSIDYEAKVAARRCSSAGRGTPPNARSCRCVTGQSLIASMPSCLKFSR